MFVHEGFGYEKIKKLDHVIRLHLGLFDLNIMGLIRLSNWSIQIKYWLGLGQLSYKDHTTVVDQID